jgi:hypothetical protein
MNSNVKVTFWLNKTKKNSQNLVPVYLRVWCDYKHFSKATGIWVRLQDWDKKIMRLKGASLEVNTTNTQLDTIKIKVLQISNQLILLGKPFNVFTIRKVMEGNEASQITLMRVCKPLVTHLARKTFATTIALTNGMNIGVLSKILGHNSIKVTLDSYGAIIDELMLRNVKELKEKLSFKKGATPNSLLSIGNSAQEDLINEFKKSNKN